MNVALDTNAYSDFVRGNEARLKVVRAATRIYLPLFVLGELQIGFAGGSQARENTAVLRRFLSQRRVSPLLPDEQTAIAYASLHLQLKRQGTPIPVNDVWIAALVVQHGLFLCTSDAHFDCLPQVSRC